MKKLNWNTHVKVKLNAFGKDIYYRRFDEINQKAGKVVIEPDFPKEDENGYTTMQLWYFMQVYAKYVGMGLASVVETFNFFIDDEELEDVELNERGEYIRTDKSEA